MPTVDLPGIRSISTDSACIARHRSSASPVILLYFTPASGLNSYVVTTGPGMDLHDGPLDRELAALLFEQPRAVHQLALVDLALALGRVEQGKGGSVKAPALALDRRLVGLRERKAGLHGHRRRPLDGRRRRRLGRCRLQRRGGRAHHGGGLRARGRRSVRRRRRHGRLGRRRPLQRRCLRADDHRFLRVVPVLPSCPGASSAPPGAASPAPAPRRRCSQRVLHGREPVANQAGRRPRRAGRTRTASRG